MRLIVIFFLLNACVHSYESPIKIKQKNTDSDFFIEVNKSLITHEAKKIDSVLMGSNYVFSKTNTGLRIWIDSISSTINKTNPQDGNVVQLLYECVVLDNNQKILNNKLIEGYLTDTISFKLGFSKQMKGLNYAIKLLKVGNKAKIIIPSYLGFGMSGYGKQVTPYATLLLNVELLNFK
jgi:peptidyl-prolyl cis-trans isomerase A (cyclophilin A)